MDNNEILLKTLQKENNLIVQNYNQLKEKYNQEKQFNTEIYNYYNVQKMIYRSVQKMRLYAKEKELQQFTRIA